MTASQPSCSGCLCRAFWIETSALLLSQCWRSSVGNCHLTVWLERLPMICRRRSIWSFGERFRAQRFKSTETQLLGNLPKEPYSSQSFKRGRSFCQRFVVSWRRVIAKWSRSVGFKRKLRKGQTVQGFDPTHFLSESWNLSEKQSSSGFKASQDHKRCSHQSRGRSEIVSHWSQQSTCKYQCLKSPGSGTTCRYPNSTQWALRAGTSESALQRLGLGQWTCRCLFRLPARYRRLFSRRRRVAVRLRLIAPLVALAKWAFNFKFEL